MKAGELRNIVTIEELQTSALDSRGQKTPVWVAVKTNTRAAILTLSGREAEQSRQLVATATHRVSLRFDPSIELTPKMRINFGGRIMNIGHVDDVGMRQREWAVLVTEQK